MMKKKNMKITAAACAVLLAGIGWVWWGNTALMVQEYTVTSSRLPAAFSGYRIAQVSDLHNDCFGENNCDLLQKLAEAEPDIILLTGDLIDSRRTNTAVAVDFTRQVLEIAPVYYVSGNHESRMVDTFEQLAAELEQMGAVVLRNQAITVEKDGAEIQLIGMDDVGFYSPDDSGTDREEMLLDNIQALRNPALYSILLSHRPELLDVYAGGGCDLVFSGHSHGGQFRLPLVGGLFAPGQGFFPEYDGGVYRQGNTVMVVSRGVGNSLMPVRFNNRPEIVLVELQRQDTD